MGFSALGVVGGIAGSLLGNKFFGSSSDSGPSLAETIKYQKELYDYKFKKEMEAMNSAHQREVTDLRAAGLNPILSATGGSGLSSPSGSMPDISAVNSATVTAKQANRQMTMNALLSFGDLLIRDQSNRINQKNANAAELSAQASLQNAETNSLETASKISQRFVQNRNIDMDTRKKAAELGLMASQQALYSAYANQANTNAWYQRSIFPYDARSKNVQGGYQGLIVEEIKNAEKFVSDKRNQMFNSAKGVWDSPTPAMFNLFKSFNTVRRFMNGN